MRLIEKDKINEVIKWKSVLESIAITDKEQKTGHLAKYHINLLSHLLDKLQEYDTLVNDLDNENLSLVQTLSYYGSDYNWLLGKVQYVDKGLRARKILEFYE